MQRGTSSPTRLYPYPRPQLTELLRITPSGRGWFMTKEGYTVKKPFHVLPVYMTSAERAYFGVELTFWQRIVVFLRRIFNF